MTDKKLQTSKERLVEGYETMLGRVKGSLDEWQHKAQPMVHDFIEKAKHKAVELEELSEHEAKEIAEYIQQDLHDIADFASDAKRVIGDQVYFDKEVVEKKLQEMLEKVADKTSLELFEFEQRMKLNQTSDKKTDSKNS